MANIKMISVTCTEIKWRNDYNALLPYDMKMSFDRKELLKNGGLTVEGGNDTVHPDAIRRMVKGILKERYGKTPCNKFWVYISLAS